MENIFSLNEVPDLEPKPQENSQENTEEINYSDPSVADMIKFLVALEPFEDEDMNVKDIPDFMADGKFNKELFAGVMLYKAPRYILASMENSREMIDFLKQLNEILHNPKLPDTIEYLESQLPYIDSAHEISEKAYKEKDEAFNIKEGMSIIDSLAEKGEALKNASQSNLLHIQTGLLFMSYIEKIYDELWKEYLVPKEGNIKGIETNT